MSQHRIARASLEVFARTGSLGGALLGDDRRDVQARFGTPTDSTADVPIARAPIWKFGDFEFHFDADDRLSLIHCDDYCDVPVGGGRLTIDPWAIRAGLTLGKLARAMYDADIDVTSQIDAFNPGWVALVTPAGVRFSTAVSLDEFGGSRPIISLQPRP